MTNGHIGYDRVTVGLDASSTDPATYTTVLGSSDTAWNPSSTSHVLPGPATVTYRRWADGGMDVTVGPAPQVGPRPKRPIRNTAPHAFTPSAELPERGERRRCALCGETERASVHR